MTSAIASLQRRLAKSGGSADDWELLAKSYEFLGRPADASKARAHQLPALPADDATNSGAPATGAAATPGGTAASGAVATSDAAVIGEVALAPALKAKATAGATLFIFAKSVDSPGPPVAVFRTTVASWPVKFKLDDSESMLPGRNLSSARRVTVEARISRSGQPLAAAGDLQGTTGVIETAGRTPLTVLIDKVVQ
jgi:cytochrome c-type biogenesis protein CcmH